MNDRFEHMLDDTVKEHPIGAFRTFAEDVEEGGSYMEEFAELLNAISTNVVVPVDDETELSKFADKAGQRVFGQIDGKDGIAFSDPGESAVTILSREEIENIHNDISALDTKIEEETVTITDGIFPGLMG